MKLIAYGANCVWWDSIDKSGILNSGLPCCPICRNVLFQMNEAEWQERVVNFDKTHKGYAEFIAWLKGKCFLSHTRAQARWLAELPPESITPEVLAWANKGGN